MLRTLLIILGITSALPSCFTDNTFPDLATSNNDLRLIGGVTANPGEFPYMASVQKFNRKHVCGGSIVAIDTILTAAQCVSEVGTTSEDYIVLVGTNRITNGGTLHEVGSIIIHENFNPYTLRNDIALLKLTTDLVLSATVSIIQLEEDYVNTQRSAVVSGWGATTFPGSFSNDLRKIDLTTITVRSCESKYKSYTVPVDASHICADGRSGQHICLGDKGSPLVSDNVQIGIASWNKQCGSTDVFTRVSDYIDFINS